MGKAPGRRNTQESQDVGRAGRPVADTPTREGRKPLKRNPNRMKSPFGRIGCDAIAGK